MRILAFAGSSSRKSINGMLVRHGADLIEAGLLPNSTVEVLDLNDFEMPIFSIDRQNENGVHPLAQALYRKIGEADALMMSFAEHNGGYSVAFKNIFDWMSRIDRKVYQDRPTVMFAASPGGGGARRVLDVAVAGAPTFGADLRASLSVPNFGDNFDQDRGQLIDPELRAQFEAALTKLAD